MRCGALLPLLAGAAAEESMTFIAIGDWGGDTDDDPTWPPQLHNVAGMATVAGAAPGGLSFVMSTGDNFYDAGIDDGKGADSPRFKETWEDVYMAKKELQVPWYIVAGNHDHNGDVNAQIKYSAKNSRWNFPALWYTFTKSFISASGKNVTTQIVQIDTVEIDGMSYVAPNGSAVSGEPYQIDPALFPPDSDQLKWLETTLSASTADYLWVAGHYPIYSICTHGPTQGIISSVLPLLKKYKATGYISGHDHCQEQLELDGLALVVSGAGAENVYGPSNINNVPSDSLLFHMDSKNKYGTDAGFASFEVSESATVVKHYSAAGKVLYTSQGYKPRSQ